MKSLRRAHSPTFPSLNLRHSSFSNISVASPTSHLILQPFRRFIYVTAHSPAFPSLHLSHSSFSNLSAASPTSQPILQHFRRFTYVTAHYPTFSSLHLRHSSFCHPPFASPTSQAPHLRHLASRPPYSGCRDGQFINELVILNYSLKRPLNSLFKCYELAVHLLIPNGMVSNGHVILSPTPTSHSYNLKTCPSPCITVHLVEYSKTINLS